MSQPWKRKTPAKPTRKAVREAFDMQRPLDQNAAPAVRKKSVRRDWDEGVVDIGNEKKTPQEIFDETYAGHVDRWAEAFKKKP